MLPMKRKKSNMRHTFIVLYNIIKLINVLFVSFKLPFEQLFLSPCAFLIWYSLNLDTFLPDVVQNIL